MITYDELLAAIKQSPKHILLHGSAGTGKSTFIQKLSESFGNRCLKIAPTGRTGLHINGSTIDLLLSNFKKNKKQTMTFIENNYDYIILDEISMVPFFKIDKLFIIIEELQKRGKFIKLIMVGDPFQLPPVVTQNMLETYSMAMNRQLAEKDFYFFYSETFRKYLRNNELELYLFNQNHRQYDVRFIEVLNNVSRGAVNDFDLSYLNQRVQKDLSISPIVTPSRQMVKFFNQNGLKSITSSLIQPCVHYPEKRFLLPGFEDIESDNKDLFEPVTFAIRAPVIFIKNDKSKNIVNGTQGIITQFNGDTVIVSTTEAGIVQCKPINFELFRLIFNVQTGQVENESVASIKRLPFILSYGVTVHRCQGMTFDTMSFNSGHGCFAPGQLYVALSRVKDIHNLNLHIRIDRDDIIASPDVNAFYDYFLQNCTEVKN
jgi:ATP-dependent exoDNAse (exonuclease V) alpha subunit